mgnify:CR=1 FL=1
MEAIAGTLKSDICHCCANFAKISLPQATSFLLAKIFIRLFTRVYICDVYWEFRTGENHAIRPVARELERKNHVRALSP